jgi:hypothetical protein
MTKLKLLVVLNKFDETQRVYLEKLNRKVNPTFEELIEIRDSFKNACLEIYYTEFEKEFIEKLDKKDEPQLKKIQAYIEKEIFRLAYDKKWKIN